MGVGGFCRLQGEADLGSALQDPCRPGGGEKRAQGHLCQGPTQGVPGEEVQLGGRETGCEDGWETPPLKRAGWACHPLKCPLEHLLPTGHWTRPLCVIFITF